MQEPSCVFRLFTSVMLAPLMQITWPICRLGYREKMARTR
jgi:hypothetical protein